MARKINLNLNSSRDFVQSLLPDVASSRETFDIVRRIGDKCDPLTKDKDVIDSICIHDESFILSQKDSFIASYSEFDYSYMNMLKARAIALLNFLKGNKNYSKWALNWEFLESNLEKRNYLFGRLSSSDKDVAHVINKGEKIEFRIRDKSGKYIPINIYQYVMTHELAHMATDDLQHTEGFWKLLSIMTFAMFEMGFYDFQKLRKFHGYFNSNGKPILSFDSIKFDIKRGIDEMKKSGSKVNYELYERLLSDM